MCGRYVLALRPEDISELLTSIGLDVDSFPSDAQDTPEQDSPEIESDDEPQSETPSQPQDSRPASGIRQSYNIAPGYIEPVYLATEKDGKVVRELRAMKWGLVPSWSKETPDYRSLMRTINCRDDSLKENRGMWVSMKHRKRCVVVAQGFYEWLNKGGKKVPYYIKRKDGRLLTFAGLWDSVTYEKQAPLYTYTIITTDSNQALRFLHDRMPVILDREGIEAWTNPKKQHWDMKLQGLLRPWTGELEVYPVSGEVSKAGKSSPSYIIPLEHRAGTIKDMFGKQKAMQAVKQEAIKLEESSIKTEEEEPMLKLDPFEEKEVHVKEEHGIKRELESESADHQESTRNSVKVSAQHTAGSPSPSKKTRSSVTPSKSKMKSPRTKKPSLVSPVKGNTKITSFFGNPK